MADQFEFIATAPFGLEGVVAEELRALGFSQVRAGLGGASFEGDAAEAFRANLWLRTADRVHLVVGRFEAKTFDALFEGVKAMPWERFIPADAAFPVSGNCARSQLMSVRDCQSITKKAIVDRLCAAHKRRTLPETGEPYPLQVALHQDVATLTLDTSGAGLSRRGYRTFNGEAPLRETLAASLLMLSPWRPGVPLHDPMCGTGTLLIEAAFIAANRAPGLTRAFACERFGFMPKPALLKLRAEAERSIQFDRIADITGADIDEEALTLARRHLAQAGLTGRIPLEKADVRSATLAPGRGIILTNPPYGERMSDQRGCEAVARGLRGLSASSGRNLCVFTGFLGFEKAFGRRADKRRRLYNGRLECELLTFFKA